MKLMNILKAFSKMFLAFVGFLVFAIYGVFAMISFVVWDSGLFYHALSLFGFLFRSMIVTAAFTSFFLLFDDSIRKLWKIEMSKDTSPPKPKRKK